MQKPARKNTKDSRKETIFKIGHLAKTIAFAKWSVWVKKFKMTKTCEKRFYKPIRVVVCKYPLEKVSNILEMDDFENRPYLKGFCQCKVYSLCKMVSLGQKLKMPKTCEKRFFRNISFVLCKKPLEKIPNIREMRRFEKSAILQRLEPIPKL